MPNFKSVIEMESLCRQVEDNLIRARTNRVQAQLLDCLNEKKKFLENMLKAHYGGKGGTLNQAICSQYWYKLEKFHNYHLKHEAIFFSDDSLEALRRKLSLPESKEKLCRLYGVAKRMAYGEKLSRKRSGGNFVSILKTELGYYVITPLVLSRPSSRSVVKIIIPIIDRTGGVELLFSKPQALKIIYSTRYKGTKESLQLLYGPQVEMFERAPSEEQDYYAKRYVVMPILPGMTIAQFHQNFINNLLDGEEELGVNFVHIVEIMRAMAKDLGRIHQNGWVHCDIKPNNMLLTRFANSFKVAIIDDDDMKKSSDYSASKQVFGAPYYHAPEVLKTGSAKNASYASDVYALGITFVELLGSKIDEESVKGEFPSCDNPTRQQILVKQLRLWQSFYQDLPNIPALERIVPQVEVLINLIERMLDENPMTRIRCENIVEELTRLIHLLQPMGVSRDWIKIPSIPAAADLVLTSSQAELDDEASDAAPLLPGHNAIAGSTKNRCCVIS